MRGGGVVTRGARSSISSSATSSSSRRVPSSARALEKRGAPQREIEFDRRRPVHFNQQIIDIIRVNSWSLLAEILLGDLGQFVVTGEPVAVMGGGAQSAVAKAGGASQPILYLEFRKDGVPVDPAPWWPANEGQKVRG
jgi:hypothetical protein